jgi:iron-sulfur cluster repair protein YtfE (RIC family)
MKLSLLNDDVEFTNKYHGFMRALENEPEAKRSNILKRNRKNIRTDLIRLNTGKGEEAKTRPASIANYIRHIWTDYHNAIKQEAENCIVNGELDKCEYATRYQALAEQAYEMVNHVISLLYENDPKMLGIIKRENFSWLDTKVRIGTKNYQSTRELIAKYC